ncbi:MAG TPA: chromate efflux transporter, partial [Baekduia sp.]|nr:chromate efflux transporter [Baekduia sp.]
AMPSNARPGTNGTQVGLGAILREWGRIGCVGFGGPPAHIALLRDLCVKRRRWISEEDFEHGIAATNLLPGPASTQLAIFCAWQLRGIAGALIGGAAFIVPGLVLIIALAALFLGSPPDWVRGLGAGAAAVVAAVAVRAAVDLIGPSRARAADSRRWTIYLLVGVLATVLIGPWLVLALLACGVAELLRRRVLGAGATLTFNPAAVVGGLAVVAATGGLAALAWTAFKVGALSYGGGFVIIPLMQADAVDNYHWMTDGEFLNAVALGQATPGPVVQTVAVIGYAANGIGGALLAAFVAFAPSFWFILLGAERFDRLRTDPRAGAFLAGAGPAAIGAILGSSIPLALALTEDWQYAVLAGGALLLFVLRRGVLTTLLAAGVAGIVLALAGASLPS